MSWSERIGVSIVVLNLMWVIWSRPTKATMRKIARKEAESAIVAHQASLKRFILR